jgi:NADPH:quinone reductase
MKALQIAATTGADGVALVDIAEPARRGSQLLIGVEAASVSFPDLLQSKGLYQVQPDLPFVPGTEFAGVVRQVPEGSSFAVGDPVIAVGTGALAEVAVAEEANTFRLPGNLSFEEGAALILNYHTAIFALKWRAHMEAGQSLLVLGAGGGVGTATIHIAKAYGAGKVIGLVSSAPKADIARLAGADEVVCTSEDWKARVLDLTGGVDLVLDPVGGTAFDEALRCLKPFGRLIVVGFASGVIPTVKLNRVLLRNIDVLGSVLGIAVLNDPRLTSQLHAELEVMVDQGRFRPLVGHTVALDRAADAYRLLDDREAVAKVVVKIGSS